MNKAYLLAQQHLGKAVTCRQCGTRFDAEPTAHLLDADDDLVPAPSSTQTAGQAPRVYLAPAGKRGTSGEIDYAIHGDDTQYVEVALDPGETVIAESGAMMYVSPGIEMQTVFGDPAQSGGGSRREEGSILGGLGFVVNIQARFKSRFHQIKSQIDSFPG
jgi:hypothetical protein